MKDESLLGWCKDRKRDLNLAFKKVEGQHKDAIAALDYMIKDLEEAENDSQKLHNR